MKSQAELDYEAKAQEWAKLPIPTNVQVVMMEGEKVTLDTISFITAMTKEVVEFGYENVTTHEVRKCLSEIIYEGKTEGDVVHLMILKYVEPSQIGSYAKN